MTERTAPTESFGPLSGHRLTKGHGTGNDFLLLTDPDAQIPLSPRDVAAVCDRHTGLGADGFIRAVRTEHLEEGRALAEQDPQAEWFMDYRNADGSVSEMCGNGVRVFVHYLLEQGLASLAEGETLTIGTRAGLKRVARTADGYAVDMGPWSFIHGDEAREGGADCMVTARGLRTPRPGLSISMGNPHTVVALAAEGKLTGVGLHEAPTVRPAPPEGTNVEFVLPLDGPEEGEEAVGRIAMRVHERGVGETQSCGTGACAAAAATRFWAGEDAPDEWLIDVPGGTLAATFVLGPEDLEHVVLAGPAQLTARITLL